MLTVSRTHLRTHLFESLQRRKPISTASIQYSNSLMQSPLNPYLARSFQILEKRQVILLYWFAGQQQTSALRRQKCASFYSKFNTQFSADLVTFTEEILNEKLHFLCSVGILLDIYEGAFLRKQLTTKNCSLFSNNRFITDVWQGPKYD